MVDLADKVAMNVMREYGWNGQNLKEIAREERKSLNEIEKESFDILVGLAKKFRQNPKILNKTAKRYGLI